MKVGKIVISILLFLEFTNPVFAQSIKKDSTEIYQYWAKRGIIEMVYAYMVDHSSREKLSPMEEQGMNNFEKDFIEDIENPDLPDLADVAIFLKNNGWAKTEVNILQPLNRRFKDTFLLDSSFFTGIINRDNYNKWDSTKNVIVKEYQNDLTELSSNRPKAHKERAIEQLPIVEIQQEATQSQLPESDSDWTQTIVNVLVFLAGLLLGGWIVYFISKRKIYNILYSEKKEYLTDLNYLEQSFLFKYIGLVYILKERKEKYKSEKGELVEKNETLESTLKEIESNRRQNEQSEFKKQQLEIDSMKRDMDIAETPTTQKWEIKTPEKAKLFFSIPEGDGRFKNHNGDSVNDGKKFYCIEFEKSAAEGDLLFITSDKDKRAINRLESYLKPVCDIENFSNAESSTRIDLISPGKVNLVNDSWEIDPEKKVKIKLI